MFAFKILTGKPTGKRLLRRPRHGWKDSMVFLFVLMGWSLLPNALRPFQIYCAPPNLGITRT